MQNAQVIDAKVIDARVIDERVIDAEVIDTKVIDADVIALITLNIDDAVPPSVDDGIAHVQLLLCPSLQPLRDCPDSPMHCSDGHHDHDRIVIQVRTLQHSQMGDTW